MLIFRAPISIRSKNPQGLVVPWSALFLTAIWNSDGSFTTVNTHREIIPSRAPSRIHARKRAHRFQPDRQHRPVFDGRATVFQLAARWNVPQRTGFGGPDAPEPNSALHANHVPNHLVIVPTTFDPTNTTTIRHVKKSRSFR